MLSVRVPSCTQKVAPKLGARNAGHEHTRAAEPVNTENMPCNQQLSPCSIHHTRVATTTRADTLWTLTPRPAPHPWSCRSKHSTRKHGHPWSRRSKHSTKKHGHQWSCRREHSTKKRGLPWLCSTQTMSLQEQKLCTTCVAY